MLVKLVFSNDQIFYQFSETFSSTELNSSHLPKMRQLKNKNFLKEKETLFLSEARKTKTEIIILRIFLGVHTNNL